MKLSKTMRLTIRVREFETVQIEVGAEISHFDMGVDDNELPGLSSDRRDLLTKAMNGALAYEVEKLAREELEKVSSWSEMNPNLADDYLGSNHGTDKKTHPASTRRLRR